MKVLVVGGGAAGMMAAIAAAEHLAARAVRGRQLVERCTHVRAARLKSGVTCEQLLKDLLCGSFHASSIAHIGIRATYLRRWRAITSSCQRLESATNRAEKPHTRTMRS